MTRALYEGTDAKIHIFIAPTYIRSDAGGDCSLAPSQRASEGIELREIRLLYGGAREGKKGRKEPVRQKLAGKSGENGREERESGKNQFFLSHTTGGGGC